MQQKRATTRDPAFKMPNVSQHAVPSLEDTGVYSLPSLNRMQDKKQHYKFPG